jgi:hypothetical protein
MDTEETSKKRDKTKAADRGFGPMGKGMFEMMNACCAGQGGTSYCSAMMKEMMEKMGNRACCAPGTQTGGKNEVK